MLFSNSEYIFQQVKLQLHLMSCKPKFPREDRFLPPIAHSTKQFRSFRTFQQLQPASQRHPTPYPSGQQHVPASQRHIPLCILPASGIIHQEPRIRKLQVGYPQSMNRRPERLNWDAHWELVQKASWNVETVTTWSCGESRSRAWGCYERHSRTEGMVESKTSKPPNYPVNVANLKSTVYHASLTWLWTWF